MTKEEILQKLQKENPHSISTFKAMDIWAKQEAIGFLKWEKSEDGQIAIGTYTLTWVSKPDIEDIYELYLQSKK